MAYQAAGEAARHDRLHPDPSDRDGVQAVIDGEAVW
jgi:hypothetical protein